ncbi:MAG: hypothetical protein ACK4TL_09255, partial [Hyphomicrobiaceae bacterium]
GEGRPQAAASKAAPHPSPLTEKDGERAQSRIKDAYEPVQPTYAQSTSRVRKPTLDEMTVGRTEVPVGRVAPPKPPRTVDVPSKSEKKGRRGRPRKTGRPGM